MTIVIFPHTLSAKLCSKFIIIYNIYIIYNNGIIFTFSSSLPRSEYDTVICHICHLSPVAQGCPDIFSTKKMTIMTNDNCHFPPHTLSRNSVLN